MNLEFVTLTMSPDNPANTKFIDESGTELYTVHTENLEHNAVTVVKDANGNIVGTLSWTDSTSGSGKVLLPGSKEFVRFDKWMSKSLIPLSGDVTFEAPDGKKYKWTGNTTGRALELWMKEDKKHPVARFYKSYFEGKEEPRTLVKAKLLIDTRVSEIRDTVVVAFIFLEKFRRHMDYSVNKRADAMANALSPAGGLGGLVHNGGV